MSTNNTDATKKILGFKYQEMVALDLCLSADDNTSIYIECFGDISDSKNSIEVKHSVNKNKNLNSSHKDFWNTLSNIIKGYNDLKFHKKFILHTTSKISDDSAFNGWNNKSPLEKYDSLINIKLNDGIKKLYDNFKSSSKKLILEILGKIDIRNEQKNIQDFFNEVLLKHNSIINILSAKHRSEFICSLLGWIGYQMLNDEDYVWEININQFRDNFKSYYKNYQLEDLLFPVSKITLSDNINDKFQFIQKLKDIDYIDSTNIAMRDYLRASESQLKMIQSRKVLEASLDSYDEEILEEIEALKVIHLNKLRTNKTKDRLECSRYFYDDTISKITSIKSIEGVRQIRNYYPKGRVHHNLEENEDLTWEL